MDGEEDGLDDVLDHVFRPASLARERPDEWGDRGQEHAIGAGVARLSGAKQLAPPIFHRNAAAARQTTLRTKGNLKARSAETGFER
ncbi:MAG: hypothetical protein M3Q08_14645 [Pseudomonadota bacterium]|nr:hypothetical protein [Pseudomonadota bacterium]